ncbi:MAG: PQQ-binding-like beta-propeller repeat protein [Acidobacteriota bacterium]
MRRTRLIPLTLTATALLTLMGLGVAHADSAAAVRAQDWPQYRGPGGDGVYPGAGLDLKWTAEGPKKLWQRPLGGGFSGLTATDGHLFTLYSKGGDEFLVALDAATGKQAWSLRTGDERKDQFGDGPRSTPVVDGDRIFAVGALGHLWSVDRGTGEVLWDRDLRKDFGAVVPTWGVSAQPVIHGDLLLFNVGGKPGHAIMAFEKTTGKVRWKTGSGIPGYALPVTFTVGGVEQTAFFTGTALTSVVPTTGEVLWTLPWKTAYDVNAAAPIFIAPDRLFVSSGYDTGAAMLRVKGADGSASVEEVWRSRRMKNQFSSSVYHDGHIYGFDNKNLKCIDAKTGQDRWRKSGFGHGSLFFLDGHFVVLGEKGKMALVEADPTAYKEKAVTRVADGKHWTVPTYYDGKLYVRNEKDLFSFGL